MHFITGNFHPISIAQKKKRKKEGKQVYGIIHIKSNEIEVMKHHQLDNLCWYVVRVFHAINNNLYNLFKEAEAEIEWGLY